jgi:hypothetical protein
MQKWVNLYNEMLDYFKGRGTCMTMDSAYMGDIMGQIGRDVWKMNLLGTCQSNRVGCGPTAAAAKSELKIGTYESIMFQHQSKSLSYTMWADVHTPEVLEVGKGVVRRRRVDGMR